MNVLRMFKIMPLFLLCSTAILTGCNESDGSTYSLSGTISSSGDVAGLILSDSLDNTVTPATGATTFAFNNGASYLYTNTNYNVIVKQQPAGLRCNVVNGKAHPNGANVSNVGVTCTKAAAVSTFASFGTTGKLSAIVADPNNNIYVVDNGLLKMISPAGAVSTISLVDANGTAITNPSLSSLAINKKGNVLYASSGFSVQKITIPATPGSGNYQMTLLAGSTTQGSTNATGAAATFSAIQGLAVDSNENVYVRDAGTSLAIRKIDTAANVSTLAGSGLTGHVDSGGTSASFDFSSTITITQGLAIDSNNYLYVVEAGNNNDVRIVNISGTVNTLAGSATTAGHADGAGTAATFKQPYAIHTDANNNVYVVDGETNLIRLLTTSGGVTTLVNSSTNTLNALTLTPMGDLYATTTNANADVVKVSFQ